jgi:small subunit ribosomal protein S7
MKRNLINFNHQINRLVLKKGKLAKANFLLDKVFLDLTKNKKDDALSIFITAVENIMPLFQIKKKKIGKRVVITPSFILSNYSRRFLGIKWIIEASLKKKGSFHKNLVTEIIEGFNNKGLVKKRQKDLNSIVLQNKSNLKYRW